MHSRSPSPRRSDRFARGLARARAARPTLERDAARYVLSHYRAHRRLPPKPALALLSVQRLAWIVMRGEIEHRLGLVALARRIAKLSVGLRHWLAGRRDTS